MNIRSLVNNIYKKYGRKALVIFLVYFVAKWTLTIFFGAWILAGVKGLF